jgi:DNA-directed RNA polymerase specialized sigma24 family protein
LFGEEKFKRQVISGEEQTEFLKEEVIIRYGNRKYLIRGIEQNNSKKLRVNLKVSKDNRFHIDTLDLYASKHRKVFAKETALLFHIPQETVEAEVNKIIEKLESYIEGKKKDIQQTVVLTEKERQEAVNFLKSEDLMEEILADFEVMGCAGEKTNKLMGYLAAVSRKLDDPLSLLILSRSAAGKSTLQDAVLEFVPDEDKSKYTRITGQALFYKGENSLQHKFIAIEEEEGASEASYSIRAIQSSKFLTIATTTKDPLTGGMKTQENHVKGPLSIILTTTRNDIDYETMSRFVVLTIDESREQTKLIHDLQRRKDTLEGLLRSREREVLVKKHHNAQRLLKPVKVVNPYAKYLTFLDNRLRARRDHKKYLSLIKAVAFLRQYQRTTKKVEHEGKTIEYIEVTLEDIEFANELANEILGRSLDELSPQSRKLLILLREMVSNISKSKGMLMSETKVSRRDIREYVKWSDHQVRDHLKQLIDLEYVRVTAGRNGLRYMYELIYDGKGEDGGKFLIGLADIEGLRRRVGKQ